ncbi:AB hydrolase-1 domain-containing protein [Ruminococcaceae bacterium BL-4]|nr:AB hydrolase-1 domain-containing protein [Ruminococcaceae bacterium BL-4]
MFYEFMENEQFNFQINRIVTYGEENASVEEIKTITPYIKDMKSWTENWSKLAEQAKSEGKFSQATYYYRMAAFYMIDDTPEKMKCYRNFRECFEKANEGKTIQRFEIPFEGTFLPAIKIDAENSKGTIMVHGGYDSFMEEFYPVVKNCVNFGYSLVMFEGPGQGQARKNGLTFRYDWEVPTSVVIDYFNLHDVNLMGISWGGYLAPRAAAFDPRIKNVICYDIFYSGLDMMLNRLSKEDGNKLLMLLSMKQKLIVNKIIKEKMKESIDLDWKIKHGMYITGTKTPYDFLKSVEKHNLSSFIEKITQNVLLLAGENDQYVPVKRMEQIKKELVNAQSVTSKV